MSTVAPPRPQPSATTPPAWLDIPADRLYRLSIAQVDALDRARLLEDLDRLELIEGLLVKKMTKNPPHVAVTSCLNRTLVRSLPDEWALFIESPIVIAREGRDSTPEPDFMLVRCDPRTFGRRPVPEEVSVAIEVSDSSLRDDTTWKKALYARAGVPAYWVVNIPARRIAVYTEPTGPAETPDYRTCRTFAESEAVPLVLDGREVVRIVLGELLPTAGG